MKNLLLICLLFFIASCDNSLGPGKRYPIEQTHGHSHQHSDKNHHHDSETEIGVENPIKDITGFEDNIYASANRSLWQRPELVIQHLGNLEGKTMVDIGAGPIGYFSFIAATHTKVEKVLALDIDEEAIDWMNKEANTESYKKIETKLVQPDDPQLGDQIVDVVLIASTLTYIDDKKGYLMKLRKNMPVGGRLVILDYKMKEIPKAFPRRAERLPLFEMEDIVDSAGFKRTLSDDHSLKFQYIIVAINPPNN